MNYLHLFLVMTLVATLAYVIRLRKRLWFASYQIGNRDRERQLVLSFLNQMGERITKGLGDTNLTLELVVTFCMNGTKADAGAIFLRDADNPDILRGEVVQGMFPPLHEVTASEKLLSKRKYMADYVKKEKLRIGEGIIGLVAKTGEALLIPDAKNDPRVPRTASEFVPLEGLILAPLVVRGEVQGVLVLINKRDDGQTFNVADRDLVTAIADQAAVTLDIVRLYEELAHKQRLEQELRMANEFQNLLLPQEMPEVPEIVVGGYSQAALEVGGDYYDFIPVDDRHLGVVIADVAGKGIPGALVMATLRSTLRAEARGDLSPRAVLQRVNEHILRDTQESIFISVTYGIIDLDTGMFRFSRAGHEPLVCFSPADSRIRTYSPNGIVLGMVSGEIFAILEETEVDLTSAGIAVLYTDGVSEAMNEAREEYGEARFHQAFMRAAGADPARVIEALREDILRFTGGIPQHDDITLVVLKWRGNHAA